MQRKNLINILFGSFLAVVGISSSAYAADNNPMTLTRERPHYYLALGYTAAQIKNADMKDFSVTATGPTVISTGYNDKYGATHGGNIKFGQMLNQHWGYEVNLNYVVGEHDTVYFGPFSGVTNGYSTFEKKTRTGYGELLGVYALALNYNLDLFSKLGVGYEHEHEETLMSGYIVNIGDSFSDVVTDKKIKSFGGAAALELRYHLSRNWALTLEANDLLAKENIIAANVGILMNF